MDNYLERKYFDRMAERIQANKIISEYYEQLYAETDDYIYRNKAVRINFCSKYWFIDYYRLQGYKDIKSISRCKDKFCINCQSMLALQRQRKFSPMLDELAKQYDIYYVVLTVPNVPGDELKKSITNMFDKFRRLTLFLNGNKKIKNVNFAKYGYVGAIRSLEVSINLDELTYHPHLHSVILLQKGLDMPKTHTNTFSYDYSGKKRKKRVWVRDFSDFEILLQKVLYLLINNERVVLSAIEGLKEGYSVIADKVEDGQYHEVFKYAVKSSSKSKQIIDFDIFSVLERALKNKRTIQPYGILRNWNFDDDAEFNRDNQYDDFITEIMKMETPIQITGRLNEILVDVYGDTGIKYFSRQSVRDFIKGDKGKK